MANSLIDSRREFYIAALLLSEADGAALSVSDLEYRYYEQELGL